jgi:hypothetical protein
MFGAEESNYFQLFSKRWREPGKTDPNRNEKCVQCINGKDMGLEAALSRLEHRNHMYT